ncbi:GNA1162 family protein [Psychromonas arctica]|uniref:GNA1162 family protein n=1 Tax=Psychromonas arctica TaxID=168275 RepID=A0ABU9HAJ1_9GAMM
MKRFLKNVIITIVPVIFLSACVAPTLVTKESEFPGMYIEKPKSLLIMPPINLSTAADAKDYYSTTVEMPVAFQGYYTLPYEITSEVLKQQGVYDSELVYDMPLNKFYEYFGADAVLFTKIKKWDTSYVVVSSSLTVSIDAEIKSTKTSQVLWKYNGTVIVDLSGGNGGGLVGLLASAIVTAINTASADYTTYARQANGRFVGTIPVGPYHPMYLKDQQDKIIQQ